MVDQVGVESSNRWIYAKHAGVLLLNVVHHVRLADEVWQQPLALR
jgi:hypothetical protein